MYRVAHVFLGLSSGLLLCSSAQYSLLCGLAGALGAYVPDVNHPPYRRGKLSHSLVVPITLLVLAYSLRNAIALEAELKPVAEIATLALYSACVGWITHVLSDSLTSRGVHILYPFSSYRLAVFKSLKSTSLVGNLLILLLSSVLIYFWLQGIGAGSLAKLAVEKIYEVLGRAAR